MAYATLLATEALEAVAFEGDFETEALAADFLAVTLATEALATEALATDAFATDALAADFLTDAALATEALAADFLLTEALTTEPLAADGLLAYCASASRNEVMRLLLDCLGSIILGDFVSSLFTDCCFGGEDFLLGDFDL